MRSSDRPNNSNSVWVQACVGSSLRSILFNVTLWTELLQAKPSGDSVGLARLGRHQDERSRFSMRLKQTLAFCFQSS